MIGNAAWSCARRAKPLGLDEQRDGCPSHLFIPALVPGELIDADDEAETVTYQLRDGSMWIDGAPVAAPRYWHHAESGCVFETAPDDADPREAGGFDAGLVEEIDAETFARLSSEYEIARLAEAGSKLPPLAPIMPSEAWND